MFYQPSSVLYGGVKKYIFSQMLWRSFGKGDQFYDSSFSCLRVYNLF